MELLEQDFRAPDVLDDTAKCNIGDYCCQCDHEREEHDQLPADSAIALASEARIQEWARHQELVRSQPRINNGVRAWARADASQANGVQLSETILWEARG